MWRKSNVMDIKKIIFKVAFNSNGGKNILKRIKEDNIEEKDEEDDKQATKPEIKSPRDRITKQYYYENPALTGNFKNDVLKHF